MIKNTRNQRVETIIVPEKLSKKACTMSADRKMIILEKSPYDENDYRLVQFPSGLIAVLIHTPTTPADTAVASPPSCNSTSIAVFVNGGSLSDPSDAQGLAHILEHCVFFGSDQYPNTPEILNNLDTYANGFTFDQWTGYVNTVPNTVLDQFFPPFCSMIFTPKLDKDQADQELRAVDDEFFRNLHGIRPLLLWRHASLKKDQPLNRMPLGSMQTLGNGDDNAPKLADHVYKAMVETHKAHYVPSAMTVAISSSKSLDEMEEMVAKYFPAVPEGSHKISKDSPPPEGPNLENLLQSDRTKQYISTKGLGSEREVALCWHLPPNECGAHHEHVLFFMSKLLENTSPKGLIQTLHDKDLVETVEVYIPNWHWQEPFTSFLGVRCRLSGSGTSLKDQVPQIVDLIFQYLEFLLEDVCEQEMNRFFEEIKIQKMNDFHFPKEKKTPLERCQDIARLAQMKGADPELLYAESWYSSEFNFQRIRGLLTYLLKQEYLMVIDTLPNDADFSLVPGMPMVEPYSKALFKENVRAQWESCRHRKNEPGDGSSIPVSPFRFVPENKYIELDLFMWREYRKLIEPKMLEAITSQGVSLKKYDNITALYSSTTHCSPAPHNASVSVRFSWLQNHQSCAKDVMSSSLWMLCVEDRVQQFQSDLSNAGYFVKFEKELDSVTFKVTGRSREIIDVMNRVLDITFRVDITEKCISHAKANFRRELCSDKPTKSLFEAFKGTTRKNVPITARETLESLRQFREKLEKTGHCYIRLEGNVALSGGEKIADHISRLVPRLVAPRGAANVTITRTKSIFPEGIGGEHCYRVKLLHSKDYRTTVTNEYALLGLQGTDSNYYYTMLKQFIRWLAFHDLRERQYLGYAVFAEGISIRNGSLNNGFSITVEATGSKYTACEINHKIDQFCADLSNLFRNISDKVYNRQRNLWSVPNTVTKENVSEWLAKTFPSSFGDQEVFEKCKNCNIQKMSYQKLSGNPELNLKQCCCNICRNFTWLENNINDTHLAEGEGDYKDYFIISPPPSEE